MPPNRGGSGGIVNQDFGGLGGRSESQEDSTQRCVAYA